MGASTTAGPAQIEAILPPRSDCAFIIALTSGEAWRLSAPGCPPGIIMNLTEAQKTQLQQLDGKRKSARKLDMQSKKENKQRNDSLRMAQRRADRKSYLEEVKAIVGPENYVLFLENTYVNGRDRNNKGATFGQGRGDKSKSAHKMHKGKDRNRHASSMRANGSTNATNTNS